MSVHGAAPARLESLKKFAEQDPGNASLLGDLYDTAMHGGDFDTADHAVSIALAHGLNADSWLYRRSHIRIAQGKHAEARQLLDGLDASEPMVAHSMAWNAFKAGDYEAAGDVLRPWMLRAADGTGGLLPADQLGPLQSLWIRNLHHQGLVSDGWDWARARLDANELAPGAFGSASLVAVDAADIETADRIAAMALQFNDRDPDALVAAGTCSLARQQPAKAKAFLAKALQLNAREGRALSAMGFVEMLEGDLAAAHHHFVQALDSMPKHIGTWHGYGWTLIASGHAEEAVAIFERAVDLDRNFAESHGALAVAYAKLGMDDLSRKSADRALGLDPMCLSARYADAIASGEAGDPSSIRKLAGRLLSGMRAADGRDVSDWLKS